MHVCRGSLPIKSIRRVSNIQVWTHSQVHWNVTSYLRGTACSFPEGNFCVPSRRGATFLNTTENSFKRIAGKWNRQRRGWRAKDTMLSVGTRWCPQSAHLMKHDESLRASALIKAERRRAPAVNARVRARRTGGDRTLPFTPREDGPHRRGLKPVQSPKIACNWAFALWKSLVNTRVVLLYFALQCLTE